MKRAIGYLRVSGAGQVDKDGEARQHDAVKKFCAANDLQLDVTFFEAGVSGTVEGLDRPEFAKVVETIEAQDRFYIDTDGTQKEHDRPAIVVERLDRLARDLMVQELLLRECRQRGIRVFAADQGQLVDLASNELDPTRKLFRQIMGALAEWEKSALVLKLRKARDRKRALTGRCEGPVRWEQLPAGKKILDKVKAYRASGLSYLEVAKCLNKHGIKTRFGNAWTKRAVIHYLRGEKITVCEDISEKNQPTQ